MPQEFPFSRSLESIGDAAGFFGSFFRNTFKKGFEWNELFRQGFMIGYKSIGIVLLTGFILGFVLTLQSLPTLKQFGAQSFAPGMVSVSMIREIGPVIIALICAGKIASGIGAELGSMNVTEQIDAMEVSGASPMQFLVVTRILVCTLMIPLLTIMADGIGMIGGFVGINVTGDMSAQLYFSKSMSPLDFGDLIPAFIKTIFFGFTIGFVGCYKGYHSNRGTESVGLAANSAVVTASIWIILIDAIVVQITNTLGYN
ncbi:MAG TPA: ABC transporter permease [Chitinophagaceae bacterium]|jgi:phospholipid/cholesterol/gamma-HCH transport system permease protein